MPLSLLYTLPDLVMFWAQNSKEIHKDIYYSHHA
jgi:hypothetical protein